MFTKRIKLCGTLKTALEFIDNKIWLLIGKCTFNFSNLLRNERFMKKGQEKIYD